MATRFQFVDDSGETRLAGFLTPDPGLFTMLQGRSLSNAATLVTDTPTLLAYENVVGDFLSIFTRTDATHLACIANGLYIFDVSTAMASQSDAYVQGTYQLLLDTAGFNSGPLVTTGLGPGSSDSMTSSIARYLTAGMVVTATASQNSGHNVTGVTHWVHVVFLPFTRA